MYISGFIRIYFCKVKLIQRFVIDLKEYKRTNVLFSVYEIFLRKINVDKVIGTKYEILIRVYTFFSGEP